ncbi:hypothetical protein [Rubrivirga sp. IMCC43871]|uniref:hypothetical protein n=1 Tax=Rubrivirga sp. IMCC43871 TaxID=3391575 RepID=UPI00398FCCE6
MLLLAAGAADAQTRIFVDDDNGVDTNTGASATSQGSDGPVRTLAQALTIARQSNNSNIISLSAGTYDLLEDIGDDTNEFNLSFEARPDGGSDTVVELDFNGSDRQFEPNTSFTGSGQGQFSFLSAGATFDLVNVSVLDFENGVIALGTGVVEIVDAGEIEVTSATVTGVPDYRAIPNEFTFDGVASGGVNPSGNVLPAIIDATTTTGTITINVSLPGNGTLRLDGPKQLGDDGENVFVFVAGSDSIDGTLNIADGAGTGTAEVFFQGDGNFGDVRVSAGADLVVENDGVSFDSFTQSGGTVDSDGFRNELIVRGDFVRTGGDFDEDFVLTLAGNAAAQFTSGSNLSLQGFRVTGSRTVAFGGGTAVEIVGVGSLTEPDLFVAGSATIDLNGQTLTLQSPSVVIVDGEIQDGLVRFAVPGGTIGGNGTYDSIRLDGTTNLSALADAEFTGNLFLIEGDLVTQEAFISTTPGGPPIGQTAGDLSPAARMAGDYPMVIVDFTNSISPTIQEVDTDGDGDPDTGFNGQNNEFDLTYLDDNGTTNNSALAGDEFYLEINNIHDLIIDANRGFVEFSDSERRTGTISGDLIVRDGFRGSSSVGTRGTSFNGQYGAEFYDIGLTVGGSVLVEDDASIFLDGGNIGSGDSNPSTYLRLNGADNEVQGSIFGEGDVQLTDGTTVTGFGNRLASGGSDIEADVVLFGDDANATVQGFSGLDNFGNFFFSANLKDYGFSGGTLTLDLEADSEVSIFGGGAGIPSVQNAGNMSGDIELNGSTLLLGSDIQQIYTASSLQVDMLNLDEYTFFVEGAPELQLGGDVAGTGVLWLATGVPTAAQNPNLTPAQGDLNGDGFVNGQDAALAAPIIASLDNDTTGPLGGPDGRLDGDDSFPGDLNDDGNVNQQDQDIFEAIAALAAPNNLVTEDDLDVIRNATDSSNQIVADGDLNGDDTVNSVDQAIFDAADIDDDNDVDATDLAAAQAGDVNNDGIADGDIDGDGDLDAADQIILNAFTQRTPADAGPTAADQAILQAADQVDNSTGTAPGDGLVDTTGDINGDGSVDDQDQQLADAADIDNDGDIDVQDSQLFAFADDSPTDGELDILQGTLAGDIDQDGDFDQDDRNGLNIANQFTPGVANTFINLTAQSGVAEINVANFHLGDEATDEVNFFVDLVVEDLLVLEGVLDAENPDTSSKDVALYLADGGTLRLEDGYSIVTDGTEPGTDKELVFLGGYDVILNEGGPVAGTTVGILGGSVGNLTVGGAAQLPEVNGTSVRQMTFTAMDVTIQPGAQLDLNGHIYAASGDLTLSGDNDIISSQANQSRTSSANPFSEFQFVGADTSKVTVPSATLLGDGVDIRINKTGGPVVMMTGSLLFDDEFDDTPTTSTDLANDETLFLESGIFIVGTEDNQQTVYIRLDHENTPLTTEDVDGGQGFVIVGAEGQDQSIAETDSYVAGNVRKRVANTGTLTPGRVIYPTGEMTEVTTNGDGSTDDDDRDYAPFTFDFESNGAGSTFGLRSINVTFVGMSPGTNDSLPLADTTPAIESTPEFYWLVSTTGSALGQGTTFNLEARADDFVVVNNVDDLELIRRQDGNVETNNYVGIGGEATTFQIDIDGETVVIVQEQGVASFLGPQGTIVTFGETTGQRPVATEPTGVLPTSFALNGNLPNPFRTRTALSFDLAEAADVSVDVYDTMGRRVANIDKGAMSAGADQRVEIEGAGLASGVYVFRLTVKGASETIVRTGQITLAR